ncbi:MAG: ATP-dependent Clp protease ATP-binding subunit, partial [Bacillota bacterium]|nr:ATP-dependent Clp protease ATP-binding subunit [Bacillota bacterium]
MNAANILKPALSRGEIQVIGATTFAEYRKYIEKDAALERRFQPVTVEEPSIDNSVEILDGIKAYYEKYHGVIIDDETVKQAVMLSERYITDRYLPDKAIDLIDEAASAVNIEDAEADRIYRLRDELGSVNKDLDKVLAENPDNYETIAKLRGRQCMIAEEVRELESKKNVLHITIDSLAKVIELWTGIPASKIKEQEFVKLLNLEDTLKSRIIGQDEAISSVVAAIKRNRAGISPKRKPVSFIFAGPTGVGKTELVKQLSTCLFDSPETFFRLDMSEFMEKHSVSRIIGAPPGYVGYDEAGQLTEKVRRKPYSVILFDEIEKAHPDVLNILLQILDDGHITDAHGKTVNFENTIIIMTTNAGSYKHEGQIGFSEKEGLAAQNKSLKALEEIMRPEFINRVDEIITFRQLDEKDFKKIAVIMLSDLKDGMANKGIVLSWDDSVLDFLVKKSYSTKYGARNLRRSIEKQIEDKIAGTMIDNYNTILREMKLSADEEEIKILI